jgi:Flp pilus assembly protein CpaB
MKDRLAICIAVIIAISLPAFTWLLGLTEPLSTPSQQQGQPFPANSVKERTVYVPVARKTIPAGTFLKTPERFFKRQPFLEGQAPARALLDIKEIKDRRLGHPLEPGSCVKRADFMPAETTMVTIPVGIGCVGGGFPLPGGRVDLYYSTGSEHHPTLAEDLLILAVDVRNGLTLRVTTEEARILEMASSCVHLRCCLVPQQDW